jgi:hypothetical protein
VGGAGSGRRRPRLGVEECRALEIGELCDAGRWHSQPRGEVQWRAEYGGALRAHLLYEISAQGESGLGPQLVYRYWPREGGPYFGFRVELGVMPGRRALAACPECGRWVRRLYALPRGIELCCRACERLVYREPLWHSYVTELRAVAGPALRALDELPVRTRSRPRRRYVESAPRALAAELAAELPLAEQELRLWCLRLRACGLSYRQIARLTESSKSGVARICAAGRDGVDGHALSKERWQRAQSLPVPPEGDDRRALAAYLGVVMRYARAHGLYRAAHGEPEQRLVIPAGAQAEP